VTLRVIVVDDEALARERVVTLLAEHPEVRVTAQCAGGREAVTTILETRPDLVFLDVQMPDLDGFEVLEAVGSERLPAVVFVTAFDEYALRAFEVHALDYLLKPITADRFQRALSHAIDAISTRRGSASDPRLVRLLEELAARDRPDRLVVKTGGRIRFLRPADIDWVEADGKYARLHVGKEVHAVRQPLKSVAERLARHGFVRIHRSAIVNVDRIRELEAWFHGEYVVRLEDGTKLTSSAAYSEALHRLVAGQEKPEPAEG
jgi:two-component system, LytTR family, response regulator